MYNGSMIFLNMHVCLCGYGHLVPHFCLQGNCVQIIMSAPVVCVHQNVSPPPIYVTGIEIWNMGYEGSGYPTWTKQEPDSKQATFRS